VATPAVLIEHPAAVASVPEPVASSPRKAPSVVPEPESAAARYERERIDAWIRNRLPPESFDPVAATPQAVFALRWRKQACDSVGLL